MYSSTSVVFGCSNNLFGRLAESGTAVDGILGLDPGNISIFSQLSSRGIIPKVFSHCLRGDNDGGTLVLGEIQEPGIIYSPLVPSRSDYNLNLQSIAVNGEIVQLDPAIFESKNGGGTVVDSGTTLIVLAKHAYNPVINSLIAVASRFTQPVNIEGSQCFKVSRRIHYKLPPISFNFEGGVTMTVQPNDYLIWQTDMDGAGAWCLGFLQFEDEPVTTLGGSQPVNVSSTDNMEVNTRHRSGSSSRVDTHLKSILASSVTLLAYIFSSPSLF